MKKYFIKEMFKSIQGEGSSVGKAVLFLRFAGCNKWSGNEVDRDNSICNYCDTDFTGGVALTAYQILKKIKDLSETVKTLVLTGGEPALQIDDELISLLYDHYDLHLETNGSIDIGDLDLSFDHITMSPKQGPEQTKLKYCNDLKILWPPISPDITPDAFRTFSRKSCYLQPVMPQDGKIGINLKLTLEEIYKNPEWRLSIQLHKVIGVE